MWLVKWNYRGRWENGGEKLFEKNYAAQSFAYMMIRKPGITQTETKFVEVEKSA
jgi:hypothetical protein